MMTISLQFTNYITKTHRFSWQILKKQVPLHRFLINSNKNRNTKNIKTMKLKYLAIFMCIASLFTSCCKEDEEDEVEESEPQSIERPDSEASPKPEIPQPRRVVG